MKKILLLILFTSHIYFIHSQNTWEYFRRENDLHEAIHLMIELKDGNYISTGGKYLGVNSDNENKNYACIRKHSKINGEVIKEVDYKIDSLSTSLIWIFYDKNNETYTIAGEAHRYFDGKKRGYFLLTHWDSDLNLISDTLVRLQPYDENNDIQFLSGIYSVNGDYIVLGNYFEYPKYPYQNNKLFFARINNGGKLVFNNYLKEIGGANHCSIIEDKDNDRFVLIGIETYYLDTNFNKTDSITTENSIDRLLRYNSTAVMFSDNNYLCSARFNSNTWKGLGLFDSDMNILRSINISKTNAPHDNPLMLQNFDFLDTSSIYVGTQSYDSGFYTIAKVNSELKPYWIKYFSENDSIAHAITGVTATSDGGFIVYGIKGKKVEFTYLPFEYGSWAIKLDANGKTVSTKDSGSDAWEITIFPNPSAGDFKIDISGHSSDAKLLLFDIQGREVKRYTDLHTGTNTFVFDKLPQGTYIWKLLTKEKEIGDGKWVKFGL